MKNELSEFKKYVSYNENAGEFTRIKVNKGGKSKVGDLLGYKEKTGYLAFYVCGKKYLAHRLAWLFVNGAWPKNQIDHINGDKVDNRISNLREVTNGENQQNLKRCKSHNKSGYLGVSKNKKKWKAEIAAGGRKYHIGTFDTPKEAHEAYMREKSKLHLLSGDFQ